MIIKKAQKFGMVQVREKVHIFVFRPRIFRWQVDNADTQRRKLTWNSHCCYELVQLVNNL